MCAQFWLFILRKGEFAMEQVLSKIAGLFRRVKSSSSAKKLEACLVLSGQIKNNEKGYDDENENA